MVYNRQITEPIPATIGNPVNNQSFQATGVAYDISIGGQPFFVGANDETPYRRVTAQYRKNQVDMSKEPGEQTLTGWWLRSQSSFHLGQGIRFFEPAQDESLRFQYTYSKGCNVWDRGQVTLLKDVDQGHNTLGKIDTNGRAVQILRSIRWSSLAYTGATTNNTYNGVLLWDEYDVDKIYPQIDVSITNKARTTTTVTLTTSAAHGLSIGMVITVAGVDALLDGTWRITSIPTATTFTYSTVTSGTIVSTPCTGTGTSNVIHFIDYNSGISDKVRAICDDGIYAYWVTNNSTSGKFEIWKKLLTDDAVTSPGTLMATSPSVTATNAVIEYTKERLVLAVNNQVFELPTNTTAWSQVVLVYTHPTNDYIYTSITSSGPAIYLTGYSGVQSTVQKFTLVTTSGLMPTLSSAITAAELPAGEISYKIFYYLGLMAIGTSKGVRIAEVSSADGSLAYGPLVFETDQPVYDFAARDRYIWCATSVDGVPGTTRIDLGQQVGSNLVYAYAWDLYNPGVTGHQTTSCAFMGATSRLGFCTTATTAGGVGYVYVEAESRLVSTGILRVGFVRYNTLENKLFKFVLPRFDTTNGSISLSSIAPNGAEYSLGTYAQGTAVGEIGISQPAGAQEYLGLQFAFTRSDIDSAFGPVFTGYQLKVLPAIPRQRLIQYPCSMYDSESDKFGNKAGYEGSAYDRLKTIETVESSGDTIKIEDFRTGESYTGIIEEIDFINKTPTDKRYSGYGGVCLITVRSMTGQ